MGNMSRFLTYFRDEREEHRASLVENARLALEWMSCGYFGRFKDWLETEASKSMDISGSHMEMVKQAVRANTLREIRAHLDRIEAEAKRTMAAAREEQ